MTDYSIEDITKSYKWLGHKEFTELNAIPSKKDNNSFTKIWYTRKQDDLENFVERYNGSYMICYGINPRPRILKNSKGYARSSSESEILKSKNMLLDFDFEKRASKEQVADFELLFEKTNQYFEDLGLKKPVRAFTGNGYHLLFAYPEIKVKENPDIAEKQKGFCKNFRDNFKKELSDLAVKLDNTQDLRRMAKVYGTAKPDIGIMSHFYGNSRIEDVKLKDYLLSLQLDYSFNKNIVDLKIGNQLPEWFKKLLETDEEMNGLWLGNGKDDSADVSCSGYDYTLVKKLLEHGYRDIDELATILALRPQGSFNKNGKDEKYIKRTIANALIK